MLFVLAAVLLVIWLISVLFGKGGFVHIVLLFALCVIVMEVVHRRRATQKA